MPPTCPGLRKSTIGHDVRRSNRLEWSSLSVGKVKQRYHLRLGRLFSPYALQNTSAERTGLPEIRLVFLSSAPPVSFSSHPFLDSITSAPITQELVIVLSMNFLVDTQDSYQSFISLQDQSAAVDRRQEGWCRSDTPADCAAPSAHRGSAHCLRSDLFDRQVLTGKSQTFQ